MMKHLLAATAIVALAGAANATETKTTQTGTPAERQSVAGQEFAIIATASMRSHLATELIGETVYASDAADADVVGEISDLVVAENGEIEGVVIDVGGFLGVGQRSVAIDFQQLTWIAVPDNAEPQARLVLPATAEQLENAPEFDVSVLQTEPGERLFGADPAGTAMAPETAAPAADQGQVATLPGHTFTDVDISTVSADNLLGTTVYSVDDENVGSVADVLISEDGMIDAVVLDIGGFLGMGTKPVAIAFEDLLLRRDENNTLYVYTGFSRAQLEGAPDYDESRYLEDREMMRLRSAT
jgi:sporulation protein YlmC with PRC-barrel domain